MDAELRHLIAGILAETGRAHHEASAASDGEDPDWAIWYAEYARDKLAEQTGMDFTRSQLVYCLIRADIEHQARSPDSDWADFYAREIVEHCAASLAPENDILALYHLESCPFCLMVRAAIDRLGIDVELRSITQDPEHYDDLVEARGRATVPVLRITSPDGEERWMPESRDIIEYLEKTYG